MLRKVRIILAVIFFAGVTLLFLDFTGATHAWLGWMAKIQFLPAVMALNTAVVIALVAITLLLGRVYCSVICPMGVMQDCISWLHSRNKKAKYRFSYSPAMSWLRYGVLALFIAAMIAGVGSLVALLAPYSSYGRIVTSLLAPVYDWVNNLLAYAAERMDSYAFYEKDVYIKSVPVLVIAAVTLVAVAVLAWRGGRTYCNTICPVGSVLGLLSKYSLIGIKIDKEKCNACGLCSKQCKASCINGKEHKVDYTRCVACMDCLDTCRHGAISYGLRYGARKSAPASSTDAGRRAFMTGVAIAGASAALKAKASQVDGGLAVIEDKQVPKRATHIVPPGAVSLRHMAQHCTGCQLCVSACPNDVLRPSDGLLTLMQPESSYESGYCRPECTRCSEVCPSGAILKIDAAEKSSIQIGRATWIRKNCIPIADGVECGNCARHCPAGAIMMIPSVAGDEESVKIPMVDTEKCIGCGACEKLCPARPFSAIYVEGNEVHRSV